MDVCAEIANGTLEIVLKDWKLPNADPWALSPAGRAGQITKGFSLIMTGVRDDRTQIRQTVAGTA
jgi:hypothetical protein